METKVIITGHSSGLGRALAEHYLRGGCGVLGLSRRRAVLTPSEKLVQRQIDLGDTAAVQELAGSGVLEDFTAAAGEVILINNAATAADAVCGRQRPAEIAAAVALNLTAPLILANHMLARRRAQTLLKIVHVSSGAGRSAYPGWSVYGATKAALDHHARCIAAEGHPGVSAASIAPGVVDTEMQAAIRRADRRDFPMLGRFLDLKAQGRLSSAEQAAGQLAAMIAADGFGAETLGDVRRGG